ncbi:hypothetical protein IMCC12053_625 [Celeribacter marinus]|uniref:Mobile element protein n=1 Tax=Celeribacter marinus TaxID=1397108 RepID=A0A0N7HI92_9RHOB|nr:hypothetical protein IMCC12053_625 [Celeribacter marinus]
MQSFKKRVGLCKMLLRHLALAARTSALTFVVDKRRFSQSRFVFPHLIRFIF